MAAEGKYAVTLENEHSIHAVLGFVSYLCNEVIFLVAGVVRDER